MGEKALRTVLDVTIGVLTQDVGKVVGALVTLGLSVKYSKEKCTSLIEHVESIKGAIDLIEEDRELQGPNSAFDERYKISLQKFLTVVADCTVCVKRYRKKSFLVRIPLSLKFEEEFDSLHARLDKSMQLLSFHMQVHDTVMIHNTCVDMDELKAQMKDVLVMLDTVKAIRDDCLAPDDTQLSNVQIGDSLVEGYILAARLEDMLDVMLVATEKKKKEASILKRLSNHDNILRFYGTFEQGPHGYLVMERPAERLQTVYDWNREDHGCIDDWRLKSMIALETALGLAYAHAAGILHRNLRSANVFLTDDGHPKIFGFFKGRVMSEPSDKKWTDAEQLRWTAPEMLERNRPPYDEKCDVFSLGVIMWELITGDSPFSESPGIKQLMFDRRKNKTRLHFQGYDSNVQFLGAFKQISLDCMEDNPLHRPTVDDVVTHLALLAPEDMLEGMLCECVKDLSLDIIVS